MKLEINTIVEFSKQAAENYADFDDWVDQHLKSITDITDTIEDVITPAKPIASLIRLVRNRKFKAFLKHYAKQINERQGKISKEHADRLKTYLAKPIHLNTFYENIDAAIQSKSIYGACCIGYIAGKYNSKLQPIDGRTLIMTNAFKNLNDLELFFIGNKLIELGGGKGEQTAGGHFKLDQIDVNYIVPSIGTPFVYFLMKLANLQIIGSPIAQFPNLLEDESFPAGSMQRFYATPFTEEFRSILFDSGVFDQLVESFIE